MGLDKVFKNITISIALAFLVLSVLILYLYGINHRFLNEWVCAANTCYLCWVLLYIIDILKQDKRLMKTNDPLFWYLSGFLLYTPCTMFVFALSFYINKSQNPFINKLWIIHGVFNTLLYLCFMRLVFLKVDII